MMQIKIFISVPKAFFSIILILLLPVHTSPFYREFAVHTLYPDSGLSNKIVTSILQDREGYMWFGTESGLNRYDGYTFKVYLHDPDDPASLPSNRINCLALNSRGELWIGTGGGGFCRYERETESFSVFSPESESPAKRSDRITTIFADGSEEFLWLGTWGEGLLRFDPESGEYERMKPCGEEWPGFANRIRAVCRDRSGRFWVGTENGLFEMDPDGGFSKTGFAPGISISSERKTILSIYEDRRGDLWIGTLQGVFLLDRDNMILMDPKYEWAEKIRDTRVYGILDDKYDRLWIGTWEGLFSIEPERTDFIQVTDRGNPGFGLSSAWILSIFIDRSNTFWAGTMSGLNLFNANRSGFRNYDVKEVSRKDIRPKYFTSIYEHSDGGLWLGTLKNGLVSFHRKTNEIRDFCIQKTGKKQESCDMILNLSGDGGENLYIGTTGGLRIYNFINDRFSIIMKEHVSSVLKLGSDTLAVGTIKGLAVFDRVRQRIERYFHDPNNPQSISSDSITFLVRDRKGRMWIGTYGGGLNLFDQKTGEFKRITETGGSHSGDYYLYPAVESADGLLWMGSIEGGLKMFDPDTLKFRNFTIRNGLPSNTVFDVAEDRAGNIWFSTYEGLSELNTRTLEIRNFNKLDGVLIDFFSSNSSFTSASGEIFFAGNNGFVSFFPESVKKTSFIPKTVITSIKKITRKGMTDVPFSGKEVPEFNSGDRMITFEYSSLSFLNPQKNRYRYRLQGLSDQWVDLGTRNSLSFGRLNPGDYILTVCGSNCFGDWNDDGASMKFRVLPAFWQTWWFRMMTVFLIISGFIVFHLSRLRIQEKRLKNETEMEMLFKRKGISPREKEIIQLVLDGKTSREIEDCLFISYGTVKNHIYNVYKKLNIKNRAELVNLFKDISSS